MSVYVCVCARVCLCESLCVFTVYSIHTYTLLQFCIQGESARYIDRCTILRALCINLISPLLEEEWTTTTTTYGALKKPSSIIDIELKRVAKAN